MTNAVKWVVGCLHQIVERRGTNERSTLESASTDGVSGCVFNQRASTTKLDLRFCLLFYGNTALTALWAWCAFRGNEQAHSVVIHIVLSVLVVLALSLVACLWLYHHGRFSWREALRGAVRCSCASWLFLVFMPEYVFGKPVLPVRTQALLALALGLYFLFLFFSSALERYPDHGNVRKTSPRITIALTVVAVTYFLISTLLSIIKLRYFGYSGQDLAYFCQIFYTTLHGRFFNGNLYQDLYYGKAVQSDFAGHNSPIMFLFLPFYYLKPSPYTLLVVRNAFITLCVWPLYLIAKIRFSAGLSALLCVCFLLLPTVVYQNLFDFYPLSLAAFFLAFTFLFYWRRQFVPFCIFLILSLFVREDVIFAVFGIGVLAVLDGRDKKWGLFPVAMSILWGILSFGVVMPHFLGGTNFMQDVCFSHLGSTPREMIWTMVSAPRSTFLGTTNLIYLKDLLTPYAGFVMSGTLALIALPYIGINLLAGAYCNTTVLYAQYSVIPVLLFFLAFLFGLKKYASGLAKLAVPLARAEQAIVAFSLALTIASLVFYTDQQQVEEFKAKPWNSDARQIMSLVPPESSVAAPGYMLPLLANRMSLYLSERLPDYHHPDPDYIIIDRNWQRMRRSARWEAGYNRLLEKLDREPTFRLVFRNANYTLYQRVPPTGTGEQSL